MNRNVALKAHFNRRHAAERLKERYGIELEPGELRAVELLIATGHEAARMLRPDHRGKDRTLYAVKWRGNWLPVVWDAATGSVITVLPEDQLDVYRESLEDVEKPPAAADERPIGQSPPGAPKWSYRDIPKTGITFILRDAPNPTDPPPGATCEELLLAEREFAARHALAQTAFESGGLNPADKKDLSQELRRLSMTRKQLAQRRHFADLESRRRVRGAYYG